MSSREPGTLPSDTKQNSKEQVKAVELRNGKKLHAKVTKLKENQDEGEQEASTALKKAKIDAQFSKFLEVFKKLHINTFVDGLMEMPIYENILKEILASKREIEEHALVNLTKNCSVLVKNKIPPKLKDPGSFSIPSCMIGDVVFHKALCDLGASINLMSFSVFRKLGIGDPKPTRVSLQLADRSIEYPRRIIEYVLVKVDKFIFPIYFVVLEMEEDLDMSLILGRPFLETGKAHIDVQKGNLLLIVGDEKIIFDVFNALKHSLHNQDCFRIYALDSFVYNFLQDELNDPVKASLTNGRCDDEFDEERTDIVAYFNANPTLKKQVRFRLEELGDRKDLVPQKSSIDAPPILELKPLTSHLKYVYLGEDNNLPVIISSSLTGVMEEKLVEVLKEHKRAFS
ncbi:uncharacterized protein [Henckelia pumila]|uniref:uncharacterized protein n=1 Tax=Henckelia pumila TaxID=405737 RepID=UPI003C6E3BF4